jgi:hypothetical protein
MNNLKINHLAVWICIILMYAFAVLSGITIIK